ncbi:hypothetical protein [Paenibacillus roseipurpureus]|uniref:Cellulase n=1 Tax=Paenibacillus roseopurpureus TaxID=2918901 RepID=A0AA96RLC5_9BACL|nr:hypothetical protein [Paenibacillus sp. MBLB1832]WNR43027.1 hypothetical protein MJB10_18135 [Paenibacillus sp. MBLB1832]
MEMAVNTFELKGLQNSEYTAVKKEVDDMVAAGYTNLRIPINWGNNSRYPGRTDASGNVNPNVPDILTYKSILDYIVNTVNPQR